MSNPDSREKSEQQTAAPGGAAPTITRLLSRSNSFLQRKGSATPRLDAELLLAEVLRMERVDLYVNYDRPLNRAEVDSYRELIVRRGRGEPVAYILGRAPFRDLMLAVDSSVLVPRPETEHVVDAALEIIAGGDWSARPPRVLDLGTGSGAIALALAAAWPHAEVVGADISEEALSLARLNARTEGLAERVAFHRSDLFEDLEPVDTFDLVVSNPPYIAAMEWDTLPVDVREYEPQEALFGGEDGLDFYRRIINEAYQFLRPGGFLVLEIGYRQAEEVTRLLEDKGRYGAATVHPDYAGHDRVIMARRAD